MLIPPHLGPAELLLAAGNNTSSSNSLTQACNKRSNTHPCHLHPPCILQASLPLLHQTITDTHLLGEEEEIHLRLLGMEAVVRISTLYLVRNRVVKVALRLRLFHLTQRDIATTRLHSREDLVVQVHLARSHIAYKTSWHFW